MKKQWPWMIVISCLLISCSVRVRSSRTFIPPGQAKKITGSKSAKPYAPGQQKKKKTVVVVTN